MIQDLPLRLVVTGTFLLSALSLALVIDRRSVVSLISHGLHITTAIAMAVMAWPQGLQVPATAAEIFFLAAAVWFVATTVFVARAAAARLAGGYHVVKMLAMAWMYDVMSNQPTGLEHQDMPDMPGMDMPGMREAAVGPRWVDIGNGVWATVFTLATFAWGYRLLTLRRHPGTQGRRERLFCMAQATMALGMSIMFTNMGLTH
ncbi:DUF5134 domain-containing protein [Mycobacterium vicinigordonae]|uniref:DUF5134 domain-containing protein n=1 Tax=Mycobacterium vicinigordonae TaxID=1719132 RepID=A0A7D6HUG9_9MYCO|nr:DUF5134 domain-containing protein [Mycobacterium vicinigordonae]QLL07712.1 DUF5134 domain-containing protein [Mycobacterium vicinigordonae]